MADFRRCLYALAFVGLITGLTMPASAQMQCSTNSVPSIARAEGYAELMGDIIIDCTGGTPTPAGVAVQGTNIAVNLDTFMSSKVTAVVNGNIEFLESLLIIDEPNTLQNPAVTIRNCGASNEDTTAGGPGECLLLGQVSGNAARQYNGTCANPTITSPAYDCHPNVFQGKSLVLVTGQTNQVVFTHVPIDPPGTLCPATIGTGTITAPQSPTALCHRIIRITNIRGDATTTGVASGSNGTSSVNAQIIATPPGGLPVGDPSRVVSRVQAGLVTPILTNNLIPGGKIDFIQCKLLEDSSQNQGLQYTFREGFSNAFKPRTLRQVLDNGTAGPYNYTAGTSPVTTALTATSTNQNVPGTSYDTESGFMNNNGAAGGDNPTNPLAGGVGAGNKFVDTINATGSSLNTGGTGIVSAGIATQGTRFILTFGNVPTGSEIRVPNVVALTNVVTLAQTGVAVLVNLTNPSGSGGVPAAAGNTLTTTRAVYEVYFANPGALEQLTVPLFVVSVCNQTPVTSPCPNLPANIPSPGLAATIQGGFAPFYAPSNPVREAALEPGVENTAGSVFGPAVLPVPRFINNLAPTPLYSIVRCSCNLLFPFVTNAPYGSGNFDTGMAIANTSLDPGITFGFRASAQSGPVQLWFYNRSTTPAAEPNFLGTQGNTECTNSATPGSCTGTLTAVPPGGMLLFAASSGGSIGGTSVLAGAPAFSGYVIAQTGFQYCHGFAFISKQTTTGFTSDNMAMGYVALVLDQGFQTGVLPRTSSIGEVDSN